MFNSLRIVKANLVGRLDDFGLSPAEIADMSADFLSHPADAIKLRYFNHGWVPMLSDGGGKYVGIDLDPGPAGVYGQVISYGRDINHMAVLANSLFEFMSEIERVLATRSLGCAFTPVDAPRGKTQRSSMIQG